MHFERHIAFQNAKKKIPRKKIVCLPQIVTLPKIFRPVTRKTLIFLFSHMHIAQLHQSKWY